MQGKHGPGGVGAEFIKALRKKREEEEADEERKRALVKAQTIHPMERHLAQTLTGSKLSATHVKVHNESYWYRARRDVGGALHFKREVEQLSGEAANYFPSSIGFEGFYYVKRANKEGDLVATRTSAGTAPTSTKAWSLVDSACKARDANPAEGRPKGLREQDLLSSHFRATVISPLFVGLTQIQRLDLVVDALLEDTRTMKAQGAQCFDVVPGPGEHALKDMGKLWVPERVPKGFFPGPHTSKLPFCTRLIGLGGTRLSLELMSPAQWKPHVPRSIRKGFTVAHGKRRALNANESVALRINEAESSSMLRHMLNQGLPKKDTDDKSNTHAENISKNKGDPLGHFFHSLPPKHQRFLLAKQRHADEARERARRKAVGGVDYLENKQKKKVTLLANGTKSSTSALSHSLRDPIKEQRLHNAQISAMLIVERKDKAQLAVRLQRIYRNTMLLRSFRRRNRYHLAIVRIQRRLRGWYGRIYAACYTKVAALAATRITVRYRIVIAMLQTKQRRMRMNAAALVIQNTLRRYNALLYVLWVRQNWRHATELESAVRGFLVRCQSRLSLFCKVFQRPRTHRFQAVLKTTVYKQPFVVAFAAAQIAATIRGALCRLHYYNTLSRDVDRRVVRPAWHLLQRIMRGYVGRYWAQYARQQRSSAIQIQRFARGRVQVLWRKKASHVKLQIFSLLQLQKVARGYLDRIFVCLKESEALRARLRIVLVPRLQACVRRKVAKRLAEERQLIIVNSAKIQRIWRLFMLCCEAKQKFQQRLLYICACAATHITRRLRGIFARKRYSAMRHAAAGHRLKSARIILRAWLRYRSVQRFAVLKEEWEVEKSAKTLMAWHALRDEVHLDMVDVRADVRDVRLSRRWARKRLRALRDFIAEAELRLPKVETQMEALDVSDVEKGWAEALENEWERLTSQLAMASEEKRLMKIHVNRCDTELLELQLEYEDIEVDIDDIATREQEEFELLRRLEIKRADVRANAGWQKRVRNERMRWRVRDVRARVLKRERKTRAGLLAKALNSRQVAMSSTLSIHKRRRHLKDATREASREDHASRSAVLQAAATDEVGAAGKLKETYDAVVFGCAVLLQSAAFETRNKKPL